MLKMTKKQKVRTSQALLKMKRSITTTLPSSKSRKKKRKRFASKLKKNESDKRLLKLTVVQNLLKLNAYVRKPRPPLN